MTPELFYKIEEEEGEGDSMEDEEEVGKDSREKGEEAEHSADEVKDV